MTMFKAHNPCILEVHNLYYFRAEDSILLDGGFKTYNEAEIALAEYLLDAEIAKQ